MRKLVPFLIAALAFADGGRVQLRQESGPFLITVFLASSDLSVLVQDRATQQPILDAIVFVEIGDTQWSATREQAQNKLLYSTPVKVDEAGKQSFTVDIQHGNDHAAVSGAIDVPKPSLMLASNWQYVALPPVFIALFAVREWLVRRRARAAILVR